MKHGLCQRPGTHKALVCFGFTSFSLDYFTKCAKMCVTMSGKCLVILVTVCLFLDCVSQIFCEVKGAGDFQHGGHTISCTREYLLGLQHTGDSAPADVKDISWSDFASQPTREAKKRGSRGGVRNRVRRRGNRLVLPAITFSNARSLSNKMMELAALVKYDMDYHQNSMICVTESWLTEKSTGIDLDGFTTIPVVSVTTFPTWNSLSRSPHGTSALWTNVKTKTESFSSKTESFRTINHG